MVQVTHLGAEPLPVEGGDTWAPGEERLLEPSAAMRLQMAHPGAFRVEGTLQFSAPSPLQVR